MASPMFFTLFKIKSSILLLIHEKDNKSIKNKRNTKEY